MAKETKKISDLFGSRLAATRKTAGLTQEALAEQIGISRRALAYYETEADNPPTGDVLLRIAQALRVSVDQLLGTKTIHMPETPKNPRMMRKLEQVARLPKNDQRAVIRHIDALANAQRG